MPLIHGLAAALAFACMNFVLKHFCQDTSSMLAIFIRGAVGTLLLLPMFLRAPRIYWARTGVPIWLRSLAGAVSVVCLFVNLKQASVGDATMLANVSPVFVILLQSIFLADPLRRNEVIGALIVVAGVATLSSPEVQGLSLAVTLIGLCGAFFAAIAFLTLKNAARTFSSRQIVWAFCLMMMFTGAAFGAVGELITEVSQVIGGLKPALSLVWLLVAGVLGLLAQLLMTKAFTRLPAIVAASLTLSMVLWGVVFESVYVREWPKVAAIGSYVVVLAGLLLVQRRKGRGIPSRV